MCEQSEEHLKRKCLKQKNIQNQIRLNPSINDFPNTSYIHVTKTANINNTCRVFRIFYDIKQFIITKPKKNVQQAIMITRSISTKWFDIKIQHIAAYYSHRVIRTNTQLDNDVPRTHITICVKFVFILISQRLATVPKRNVTIERPDVPTFILQIEQHRWTWW